MRLSYYPETDSLYIDLAATDSVDSREISDGVVVDYDINDKITGIDIDHASKILNLRELVTDRLPIEKQAA
ncbi:MAG: DUF2283 domain-containing protein [Gammaproteobacteria bacterium]|nr:DUF2283 domain-containing protein [Gammaproteobacteria bacterium]NNJ84305.1 DUF2283 domain-containing protein [Gammaproteobacteria bacterium]